MKADAIRGVPNASITDAKKNRVPPRTAPYGFPSLCDDWAIIPGATGLAPAPPGSCYRRPALGDERPLRTHPSQCIASLLRRSHRHRANCGRRRQADTGRPAGIGSTTERDSGRRQPRCAARDCPGGPAVAGKIEATVLRTITAQVEPFYVTCGNVRAADGVQRSIPYMSHVAKPRPRHVTVAGRCAGWRRMRLRWWRGRRSRLR